MKKFKKIISLLLVVLIMIPFVNASAATKLERVKNSLGFNPDDDLKGHTEKDLLTRNYDFNKNAKFTSNDKLMYRFALAYAVRNTASRDKGKLYTNEWFEKHYKEILDKAYAGADTSVDFYKDKDNNLCIKIHIKNIYLDWGFRDAIRTEIIKDMAQCGVEIPRKRIIVTSSEKEDASRINPCPGLSNTLLALACASDSIRIEYFLDGTPQKGHPGEDKTNVVIKINSNLQEALQEYAAINNMTEFKAFMRLFNSIEFDNLIDVRVYFNDYLIRDDGVYLESDPYIKSNYGISVVKIGDGEKYTLKNDAAIYYNGSDNYYEFGKDTAYNWLFDLQHQ